MINKKPAIAGFLLIGGERGIRTLDTLLTYTHFPGVRLQPLGHLSVIIMTGAQVNQKGTYVQFKNIYVLADNGFAG